MKPSALSPPAMRLVDFLGELGGRWGNPALPCRVHAYLYLVARPVEEGDIRRLLGLDGRSLEDALEWLKAFGLAEVVPHNRWRTDSDPWTVMIRALEERRRRELAPALALLRECRRDAANAGPGHRIVHSQISKLLAMAEDLAAIDAQASRLSPASLSRLIRLGGRAARFLDRRFGRSAQG